MILLFNPRSQRTTKMSRSMVLKSLKSEKSKELKKFKEKNRSLSSIKSSRLGSEREKKLSLSNKTAIDKKLSSQSLNQKQTLKTTWKMLATSRSSTWRSRPTPARKKRTRRLKLRPMLKPMKILRLNPPPNQMMMNYPRWYTLQESMLIHFSSTSNILKKLK